MLTANKLKGVSEKINECLCVACAMCFIIFYIYIFSGELAEESE